MLSTSHYDFAGVTGQQYGVSVFSYDSSTSTYGSPVSDTITAQDPPPVPVEDLRSEAERYSNNTSVRLTGTDPDNHDTKSYLVSVREGMDTPHYDPVTDDETQYRGSSEYSLKPRQVYTVAVRGQGQGQATSSARRPCSTSPPGRRVCGPRTTATTTSTATRHSACRSARPPCRVRAQTPDTSARFTPAQGHVDAHQPHPLAAVGPADQHQR